MIRDVLDDLFSKKFLDGHLLDGHLDEWGIVEHCDHPTSLGYSTTITPRTIYEAVDRSVDVIVTHHDAWKFMFEQSVGLAFRGIGEPFAIPLHQVPNGLDRRPA